MQRIAKTVDVNCPIGTVYDQWTRFEQFPQFMSGVKAVERLDDRHIHWNAEIAGVDKEWSAEITEQVPDERIAWRTTSGDAPSSGLVSFEPLEPNRTRVRLEMQYEPQTPTEELGELLGVVDGTLDTTMAQFKSFVEQSDTERSSRADGMQSGRGSRLEARRAASATGDGATAQPDAAPAKQTLKPLPYEYGALAPHLGPETVEWHYQKHHRGYVDKMNELVKGGPLEGKPLEEIVLSSDGALFNNAAQVWNHDFYWRSMSPRGGGDPSAAFAKLLRTHFGGVDALERELGEAAKSHFGSGYAWLVLEPTSGKLQVIATHDAENPLVRGERALLGIDVWEHAYYLDYRNARANYVDAFLQHLINWQFAEENLAGQAST